MFEEQEIVTIEKDELLDKVRSIESEDYRLVQISCMKTDNFYVDYTFDKEYKFYGIRVILPLDQPKLQSISDIYFAAFIYENEIHDLFGIKISGIKVDFKGKFYRIAKTNPFSSVEVKVITEKG
jgi:ech hydrogenase subunit D